MDPTPSTKELEAPPVSVPAVVEPPLATPVVEAPRQVTPSLATPVDPLISLERSQPAEPQSVKRELRSRTELKPRIRFADEYSGLGSKK